MSQNYSLPQVGVTKIKTELYTLLNNTLEALRSGFEGPSKPTNPIVGQVWKKTVNGKVTKIYEYTGNTNHVTDGEIGWVENMIGISSVILDLIAAKGSKSTLAEFLNVAFNQDGTLKASTTLNPSQWVSLTGQTFAYVDTATFTVTGNQTDIYTATRRLKINLTGSTVYSEVVSSSYDAGQNKTTVIVLNAVINSTLTSVEHSIISPVNSALSLAMLGTSVPLCTPLAWQNSVNLKMTYATAATVTVTADEIILQNTSNYSVKRFATVNETISITVSGAGGLDTGIEANSTWYHIWLIGKTDGTIDGLFSTSATAPSMPSGYTYKSYVGAIYNNLSGDFVDQRQRGNYVHATHTIVVSAGTSIGANVNLTAAVPLSARIVHLRCRATEAAGTIALGFVTGVASGGLIAYKYFGGTFPNGSLDIYDNVTVLMETAQSIYYGLDTGDSVTITVIGWEY